VVAASIAAEKPMLNGEATKVYREDGGVVTLNTLVIVVEEKP
jgi:hypothetical protein